MGSERKVVDCRRFPSDISCTLTIAGTEEEVLHEAVRHAVQDHGHQDSPELREQIRNSMVDESEFYHS